MYVASEGRYIQMFEMWWHGQCPLDFSSTYIHSDNFRNFHYSHSCTAENQDKDQFGERATKRAFPWCIPHQKINEQTEYCERPHYADMKMWFCYPHNHQWHTGKSKEHLREPNCQDDSGWWPFTKYGPFWLDMTSYIKGKQTPSKTPILPELGLFSGNTLPRTH